MKMTRKYKSILVMLYRLWHVETIIKLDLGWFKEEKERIET